MSPASRSPVPYALFFLSGISGLVYQVVWVRQFGNLFGNTVHSAALVTAVFMCGLGVGSYLAGVWADRQAGRGAPALLAAYGWSEVAIGVLGAILAWVLPRLAGISAAISSYTRDGRGWYELSAGSHALRYAVAAILLAPMTLLMGGTLTLLIRYLVAGDLARAGARIGALYGFNTAGAALGCFLTDFALVPALGLGRTQIASAAINLAVGAAAAWAAKQPSNTAASTAAPAADASTGAPAAAPEEGARHAVALTAAAIALTGFAGMGMEIVWLRFLSGALGQFRAVFSLLLTVILVGMWAGALLGGWIHRRFGRPATAYVIVEALFVLATLALLASFDRAAIDRHLVEMLRDAGAARGGLSRGAQAFAMARAIALVVGLPSLLMGASFPLANANVQRVEAQVGRRAGALYLANTAGSVLGSLLAGFVLLPRLGAQQSVLVLAVAAAVAVVPLQLTTRRSLAEDRPLDGGDYAFAAAFVALAAALVAWALVLPEDHLRRRSLPDPHGDRFIAVSEGPSELLAVGVDPFGNRRLWTNGHSMSTTDPEAQRYMRAFAHVPLLMTEAPRDVLVICFGVGNTVHAASLHPSVAHLDLADLSRNVLDHGRYFAATNGGVLDDPRMRVLVNDGRQHLRMMPPGSYDLVTLEPPPISYAGVSALYSKEFYELAKSRLKPEGFVTQWLPVEQLAAPETLALVRAFLDVFPNAVLLSGERRDLVLLGTTGPSLAFDVAAVARRLRDRPAVAADLERVQLGHLAEIAGTFAANTDTLRRVTAGAAPVTDDVPSMEYSVVSKFASTTIPRDLFDVGGLAAFCPACAGAPGLDDLAAHLRVLGRLYGSDAFLRARSLSPRPVEVDLPPLLEGDDGSVARAIARSGYLQRIVGIDSHGLPMSLRAEQLAALETFASAHPESSLAALRLGLAHLAADRFDTAEAALRRAAAAPDAIAPAHFGLARALRRLSRTEDAIAAYRRGIELAPRDVLAHLGLAEAIFARGKPDEALPEIQRVLEIDPHNGVAHRIVCADLARRGALDGARAACQRALEAGAEVDEKLLDRVGIGR
ncbi:MAG: tetratricopeptide repeat protein [Minicystis sp.]